MDADNVNVFFCAGTPDNISDIATHVDGGCVWLSYTGTSVGATVSLCDVTSSLITDVIILPNGCRNKHERSSRTRYNMCNRM
ncbi:MAG: hypothetical protein IPP53_17950 [Bacteroidetes bacterium]|nr:hypothetical protein [Bacteroidota bacterium]